MGGISTRVNPDAKTSHDTDDVCQKSRQLSTVGITDASVSGMTDPAREALDALRRWAGTSRAELVAAAWRAGNTNITALAEAARRGRDAIYADLRAQGIDPTDRSQPPMTTPAPTEVALPVPGWRHPHLLEVTRNQSFGRTIYRGRIKPFTGREDRPTVPTEWDTTDPIPGQPDDRELRWQLYSQRSREIDLVRQAWAFARFDMRVLDTIRQPFDRYITGDNMPTLWQKYIEARDQLTEAYAALDTTPDTMWRAALLKIHDAKKPAEEAAAEWDRAAAELAKLSDWLLKQVGEEEWPGPKAITDAAAKDGINTSDWLIGSDYDYEHNNWSTSLPPAGTRIAHIIKTGDARIQAVQQYVTTE